MTYIDPEIPAVLKGDPGRLSQVLLNLVGNAIKFTERGSVVVRAELSSKSKDSCVVRFSVADTGIGLDSSQVQKLFQPFSQADGSTARKYGGTGLGLSICKKLVELMNGEIGVTSEVGQGSTFWFTITTLVEDMRALDLKSVGSMPNFENTRVLIVDDDPPAGDIICGYLQSWNVKTTVTNSAEEAVSLLCKGTAIHEPFSLAILDKRMPWMDGFELAEKIRETPDLRSLPLLLITAYDRASQAETAKRLGFSGYLTKPLRKNELLSELSKALNRPEMVSAEAPKSDSASSGSLKNKRILVAEDNQVNQMLVMAMLRSLGCAGHAVGNGGEAVAAVKNAQYDLVLMDCQMPEMDGFEATKLIREYEAQTEQHLPILALTANAMQEDVARCLAAGMDDFISKPVKLKTLMDALQEWLHNEPPSGAKVPD